MGIVIQRFTLILWKSSQTMFIAFMPNISVHLLFTRVYAQTHVFKISIYKGSQWVLFVATHVFNDKFVGVNMLNFN